MRDRRHCDLIAHANPDANLAFSTIEVVVSRNDTMDQLFRRFELNLADLASLRNLPEMQSQIDRLEARRNAAAHAS